MIYYQIGELTWSDMGETGLKAAFTTQSIQDGRTFLQNTYQGIAHTKIKQ